MVKNAIKVYARLKPEKNRKHIANYQVHHRPKENSEEDFLFLVTPTQRTKDYPDNRAESWQFSFFRIFEESATQEDVFKNVAQPVVESALDGYNGTIFAYGQTASGKTYSMTGKRERPEYLGIVPRSLLYLFDAIQKRPENVYSIEVAYLEIYNENGYDLLDRNFQATRLEDLPRVTVQEDEIGRLHLKNLTFHCVGSAEDAFELLTVGDSNRVTVETPMNPESSRSHCVFTIVVCAKKFGADEYKRAKVHLVDLAGSERVYKCSISGTILTEAKHINLSLHYLEQVIVCLGQESAGHIPYRNSLLTSILRDSLGGNCLTTMLATVSVASYNLEETVSACKFAQRVALINNDVRLVLEKDVHSENALLRLENEKLRKQIKEMTKEITIEELTAEDKRNLDYQIRSFLESNEPIKVDDNLKKFEYCFESFKRIFKLNRDPNSCLKKLEYYKDLVMQRDKEISLLIDLIKKEGKKGTEGLGGETLEDTLKTIEKSNNVVTNHERSNGHVEPSSKLSAETDDRVSSSVNNIPSSISSKKQKTRSKITRSLFQRNSKANSHQNSDRTNLYEQFPTVKQNLLPCNVVNLTLNDSTEIEETSQQSFPKKERKMAKQVEIEPSELKNAESSSFRNKNERAEVPFLETNDSTPVYQRFLSFNVPKNIENSTVDDLNKKRSINQTSEAENRINIDPNERCRVSKLNHEEDTNCKPRIDLKFNSELRIPQKRADSTDRSVDANLTSINESLNAQRTAKPMENEAKESREQSTRSNACHFDKINSNRSKTGEKRTSVSSFAVDHPEKSYVYGEQSCVEKTEVGRTFNYDASRSVEGSLPLTGDPEIDEEIIAFYKAKRSGGTY